LRIGNAQDGVVRLVGRKHLQGCLRVHLEGHVAPQREAVLALCVNPIGARRHIDGATGAGDLVDGTLDGFGVVATAVTFCARGLEVDRQFGRWPSITALKSRGFSLPQRKDRKGEG
jgi:hypothetical protein